MKKEKLRRLPHVISGTVILLHSLERFDTGHSTAIVFLLAGIVFLSIAAFHHKIAHRFPFADTVFYLIEGALAFIIAWEYFHSGKSFLPYLYIFAGLMQLFATYMFARRAKKLKH